MNASIRKIRERLGHFTMEWSPAAWLDTGVPDLNQVLGHRDKGLPYGRIIEMAGWESMGKTALALSLCGAAQRDGATVIWADFENSFNDDWARLRGLDPDSAILIQPYVGKFRKPRLSTAQELCTEVESAIIGSGKRSSRKVLVVDSVASMLPEGEALAGLEGGSMRSRMDLPLFLGALLRRWVAMVQSYSALSIFINQLRQSPMAKYGDPTYTPGGNALKFYSHVRVRVRRAKGGRIMQKGKLVGIQGIITSRKNKTGGLEGSSVGYRLMFDGPVEFLPAKDLEREEE
jgi:recombination protein RecA